MKKSIITIALSLTVGICYAQTKLSKISSTISNSNAQQAMTFTTKGDTSLFLPNSVTFMGSNSKEPILTFKANGDIIYKGRKLVTDTAIVNGFRELINGTRKIK